MELLLRTNFDIPRPHSGSFDPLSYLSLSAAASKESSAASRNGSRSPLDQNGSDSPNSESRLPTRLDPTASDLINAASAPESLTPTAVLTLARSILAGSHAVPTRLKILLDRAFDRLSSEERNIILTACSWNYEDYLRGYKLKDANGVPLDRWTMCTKGEETLLLHQFLAFTETRTITQQLILQDLADRSLVPPVSHSLPPTSSSSNISHDDIKDKPELDNNDSDEVVNIDDATPSHQPSPKESLLKMVSSHKLYNRQPDMSPPRRPASNASEEGRMRSSSPLSYNARRSVSPLSTSSAKENMFSRRLSSGIPLPPSSTMAGIPQLAGLPPGFPMFPFHGLPAVVSLPQSSIASPTFVPSSNADNGALNLSRLPNGHENNRSSLIMDRSSSPADSSRDSPSRRRNSTDNSGDKRSQLPDDLGITFVSPSTGKKRVQCNVCMKTFCDKGALKIHFSAVHLREMHKCTVPGCNMMFSSRRSRNRHSANPNPKLHTPTVKRRISQTDGRTHPGPITPLIPKEPSHQKSQKENFGSLQNLPAGFPPAGLPFPGLPGFNPFLPPDLKSLQADLQRISDLHKLYNNGAGAPAPLDLESLKNRAAAMASLSAAMNAAQEDGNRKRKSQNPTKRPHLDLGDDMAGVEHVSSDSASDEGFPDPMMDNDDDDIDSISVDDDQN